jgi:hypothetical protein
MWFYLFWMHLLEALFRALPRILPTSYSAGKTRGAGSAVPRQRERLGPRRRRQQQQRDQRQSPQR